VGQVTVSFFKVAVVGMAVLVTSSQVLAQSRTEVLTRIAPVGRVAVEGQAAAVQPAPAPAAESMAESAPAPAAETLAESAPAPAAETLAESAPAVAAESLAESAPPAPEMAKPASGGAGAELFVSKTCSACHGADADSPIMPVYPKLAGQNAQYLVQQMQDIKSGARDHGQTMLMKGIMATVSEDEIKAIADWLGTL